MDQIDSAALESLSTHGRTFRFASRWLGRQTTLRAARLYRFCRWLDDLVDNPETSEAGTPLGATLDRVRWDLDRGTSEHIVVQNFLSLCEESSLDHSLAGDLMRGFERDLGSVRIRDVDDLLVYAYQVAGTVGAWMHTILGAESPDSRAHAVDLGIAMQISNICRDVHEDAARDRVYLPPEWTGAALEPEQILRDDPFTAARVWRARHEGVRLARDYYRSGDEGLLDLPFRNRFAIAVASRAYSKIGHEAARVRPGKPTRRARVGRFGKLCATLDAALFSVRKARRSPPRHEVRLHEALIDAQVSSRIQLPWATETAG